MAFTDEDLHLMQNLSTRGKCITLEDIELDLLKRFTHEQIKNIKENFKQRPAVGYLEFKRNIQKEIGITRSLGYELLRRFEPRNDTLLPSTEQGSRDKCEPL